MGLSCAGWVPRAALAAGTSCLAVGLMTGMMVSPAAAAEPKSGIAEAREQLSQVSKAATKAQTRTAEARKAYKQVADQLASQQTALSGAKKVAKVAGKQADSAAAVATKREQEADDAELRASDARAVIMRIARDVYSQPAGASELLMLTDFFTDGSASLGDFSQQEMAEDRVQSRLLTAAEVTARLAESARNDANVAAATHQDAVSAEVAAQDEAAAAKREARRTQVELRTYESELAQAKKSAKKIKAKYETAQKEFKSAFLAGCSAGGTPGTPTPPPASSGSQGKLVWDTLLNSGVSQEAAAGVLGNLQQESNVDPTVVQNGGPGMGLAQWSRGGRWDNGPNSLLAYADIRALDPWSAETQIEFMLFEMSNSWGGFDLEKFKKMTDIAEATVYFHDVFERSADSGFFVNSVRVGYANMWYATLSGSKPSSGNKAMPALTCPS
ncbi:MAG: hypothetical protein K0U64_04700 [Actinomycetia bacterium]|nr:hypothetical protein [Actinomycetes bacterium]